MPDKLTVGEIIRVQADPEPKMGDRMQIIKHDAVRISGSDSAENKCPKKAGVPNDEVRWAVGIQEP